MNTYNKVTKYFPERLWLILTSLQIFKSVLFLPFIKFIPLLGNGHHFVLSAIPGSVLIVYSILLFLRKYQRSYVLFISCFIDLLMIGDLLYFRYYASPLTFQTFQLWKNTSVTITSCIAMIKPTDLLLILDIPIIVFLLKKTLFQIKPRIGSGISVFFLGLILVSIKPVVNIFNHKGYWANESSYENILNWGCIGFHFIDLYKAVTTCNTISLSESQVDSISIWLNQNNKLNLSNNNTLQEKYLSNAKGKNLIVIQCESLGGFVINNYYKGKEITPNINALIRKSLYFNHYHSQNLYGGSADAEFILFTSLYPVSKGSVFFRFPTFKDSTSLPLLLKRNNYSTIVFHDNDKSFWNRDLAYKSLGIDKFYDIKDIKASTLDLHLNNFSLDEQLFTYTVSKLKEQKQPFFSLIITIDTHLGATTRNVDGYLNSISSLDHKLGIFLSDLQKADLLDNSMLVIYGDHPPYLDVNGIVKDDSSFSWMRYHGRQVPLIIHIPTVDSQTITKIGGQIDALPTIAYLLGIDSKLYSSMIMGHNLLDTTRGFVVCLQNQYLGDEQFINTPYYKMQMNAYHISDLIIRGKFFERKKYLVLHRFCK